MSTTLLYMETTAVPAEKTAMEIMAVLQQAGCSSIQHRYEGGKVAGLAFSFVVTLNGRKTDLLYDMPVRVEQVYRTLRAKKKGPLDGKQGLQLQAKSERVAWRQLYRWIQAQLAMIQIGMVQAHEVFMPYEVQFLPSGERLTRFEAFNNQLLLGPVKQ